jgi:hypothetical protein
MISHGHFDRSATKNPIVISTGAHQKSNRHFDRSAPKIKSSFRPERTKNQIVISTGAQRSGENLLFASTANRLHRQPPTASPSNHLTPNPSPSPHKAVQYSE